MYELCIHIAIKQGTPEERTDEASKLPIKSLLHLLNCLPLDPLPSKAFKGEPYMVNSLRIAISKVIEGRVDD